MNIPLLWLTSKTWKTGLCIKFTRKWNKNALLIKKWNFTIRRKSHHVSFWSGKSLNLENNCKKCFIYIKTRFEDFFYTLPLVGWQIEKGLDLEPSPPTKHVLPKRLPVTTAISWLTFMTKWFTIQRYVKCITTHVATFLFDRIV